MGGITTGVGLFSGIDSASLIDQLISLQSRPQVFAQQRIIQLKSQQSAYLDINSRLNNFKSAAAAFRTQDIFASRSIASSNESVLTASASSAAVPGSYNFIVDRLVSTQQLLTRGFADLDTTALGLSSITFESEAARLDANTALADLNDGAGITRGKITVNGTEVDLSRSGTVQEVLDSISSVTGVSARVENNKIVIDGLTSISEDAGAGILSSLGLDGTISSGTLTGTAIFQINDNTSLQSLNDGRGVAIRETSGIGVQDFTITIDIDGNGVGIGTDDTIDIRIGEIEGDDGDGNTVVLQGAVSTIGGVVDRINTQLSDAGYSEFTASINTTTGGIDIIDSSGRDFDVDNFSNTSGEITTARDLGIEGSYTGGTANGTRVLAGLNTKLISSLNGGTGLGSTDGILNIQTQDGAAPLAIDVSGLSDVNDIINKINTDSAGTVTASVNTNGTGIQIVDNTAWDSSTTFSITGTGGSDAAAALGLSGSYTDGIADGSNLQLAYIGEASLLSELNDGTGIGTGTFEIVDANGIRAEIIIASSDKTIGDVLKAINTATPSLDITARINDNGDGITIEDTSSPAGGAEISIADVSGSVASKLNIDGTAADLSNNFITGSFEKVVTFAVTDTLEDVRNAINAAGVGVSASVINTGIGSAPFRLNLTSELTGEDGRFLVDTGGFDLGLTTLDEGNDSRVFFGSDNAATGVLLTSSSNQLDGVVQGVTIDLLSSSTDSVEISVSTDTGTIESKVQEFVDAFNNVIEGIDFRTRYDDETEERGILLGDGTLLNLRSAMFSNIRKENDGFTGAVDSLSQAGINVGSGGKLEFDAERFREAYAADPQAVEDLFSRQTLDTIDDNDPNTIDEPFFTELSVLGQIEAFAESYVTSIGGVLQNRSDSLDAQIKLQEDRIESIQKGLDNKRVILQRQFLAMEQAIGAFQSQGSALAQIAAIG